MINLISKYIKNTLDEDFIIEEYDNIYNFSIYIKEDFDIFQGKLLDNNIIFITPRNDKMQLTTIKKRLAYFYNMNFKKVAIVYKELSEYNRKKLIQERIPFIILSKQIYLPFIGLEYSERSNQKSYDDFDKFTPSAQLTFLYLLYNNKEITINQLSKAIKKTEMTASRALDELVNKDLLKVKIAGKTGRKKIYSQNDTNLYYKKGYKYLKSPIYREIHTYGYEKLFNECLIAGESALDIMTMISYNKERVYAVSKDFFQKHIKVLDNEENDNVSCFRENMINVEVWNYDPKILSNNEYVDAVSLKLSLERMNDERIEHELDRYMRGFEWYRE